MLVLGEARVLLQLSPACRGARIGIGRHASIPPDMHTASLFYALDGGVLLVCRLNHNQAPILRVEVGLSVECAYSEGYLGHKHIG